MGLNLNVMFLWARTLKYFAGKAIVLVIMMFLLLEVINFAQIMAKEYRPGDFYDFYHRGNLLQPQYGNVMLWVEFRR